MGSVELEEKLFDGLESLGGEFGQGRNHRHLFKEPFREGNGRRDKFLCHFEDEFFVLKFKEYIS